MVDNFVVVVKKLNFIYDMVYILRILQELRSEDFNGPRGRHDIKLIV